MIVLLYIRSMFVCIVTRWFKYPESALTFPCRHGKDQTQSLASQSSFSPVSSSFLSATQSLEDKINNAYQPGKFWFFVLFCVFVFCFCLFVCFFNHACLYHLPLGNFEATISNKYMNQQR